MSASIRPLGSAGSAIVWSAILASIAGAALVPAPTRALREVRVPARCVDLASASADEIALLPGVGPALASRIVAARAVRPFESIDELARVEGVGEATLASLRAEARIGRPATR